MFAYYVILKFCPLPIFLKGWILSRIGMGKLETQTIYCEIPLLDHNLKEKPSSFKTKPRSLKVVKASLKECGWFYYWSRYSLQSNVNVKLGS